jgi:general secretion pathway protein J
MIADRGLQIADSIALRSQHTTLPDSYRAHAKRNRICILSASSQRPASDESCRVEARGQHRDAGFTLMEILIAIAILALVVTTALASFNAVFSTTETLDNSAKLYEMAHICMKRIVLDLTSMHLGQRPLYKPPEFDQPPDPYRLVATTEETGGMGFAQTVRFTSRAHLPFEKSSREGIAEIIYYLQATNNGYLELKRADNPYPYPAFEKNGSDPVLCKYVKSLSFTFFDKDGIEFDVWDSDSDEFGYATPAAIGVKLELANKAETHTFETMVSLPLFRDRAE